VQVGHLEAGRFRLSADTPMVQEVRTVLERALRLSGPNLDVHRLAGTVLSDHYGHRMIEISSPPDYVWVWIGDHWQLVCLEPSTFEIDFGVRGKVAVRTDVEMSVH